MANQVGLPVDNVPGTVQRVFGRRFVEGGAATTYTWDLLVPAYSFIQNIQVFGEVLWTAGTSAFMDIGDYTTAATPVALDADGFLTQINLKATDLTAGQDVDLYMAGGKQGAYGADAATPGSQWLNRGSAVDRWLRTLVTTVGVAGTAGRTNVFVTLGMPVLRQANSPLYPA